MNEIITLNYDGILYNKEISYALCYSFTLTLCGPVGYLKQGSYSSWKLEKYWISQFLLPTPGKRALFMHVLLKSLICVTTRIRGQEMSNIIVSL